MKYIRRIPPSDKAVRDKLISEGWERLKEPTSLGKAILLSIPFMIINSIIFMSIIFYIYPPFKEFLHNSNDGLRIAFHVNLFPLVMYIIGTFVFVSIHEFLHACFIPNGLKSDKVYWGISGAAGFVYTTEKIKKGRFLIICIVPFIVLSVILPFILKALGWLNGYTIFLCLMNAAGASVDLLNICIISVQVPKNSYIINNGFETYYKQRTQIYDLV
ncbi:DUF3267 domain-containing protein [Clostridium oceanicum]|uniref:DUF3267 domain-containing protein n=1 Tax=Clostridium oceanicum TaxID=1543 RepID=A0ABN1JJX3_9CLOT